MNTNKIMERLNDISIINQMILDDYEGDVNQALIDNELITFNFKGVTIINPLYDESLVNEVNPIEYYGMDNLKEVL